MIEKAFKGSKIYWLWLSLLFFGVTFGFVMYLKQLSLGLGITGMGKDVSWGLYIANFTFFVGVAASAFMILVPYYFHGVKAYGTLIVLAEFLAAVSVLVAIAFVFVDLGKPERVLNIFLYPSFHSLLFWDVIVLSSYLIINVILGWSNLSAISTEIDPPSWTKILFFISIPFAIAIHTVTAFIYCGLIAKPFWASALLAPRFLASAFTSGPAILLILCRLLTKLEGFFVGEKALQILRKTVAYALSVHIFFILIELFTVFYGEHPEHVSHLSYVFFGYKNDRMLVPASWGSLFVSIFSFVLLTWPKLSEKHALFLPILILLVIAIWLDKGLILVVGGFNPTYEDTVSRYVPTFEEVGITIGVWSFGFLILTLLVKITVEVKRVVSWKD
ncbi:MAG: polysulfide reductase NrfD [Desulfobacterota bacterium]|nr:polysulfide reductase NrfD [Thermodesulfobacteriota bacterium]MDW8001228.1 NrfD/PsrC family molybdoenzyme membrane anchor subunit [Deltaproteobacteria bacterium]